MTEVKQKIASKTATKNAAPVSSKQKAQNTQPGGPTIGGVAGVGKQKTVTRPNSSRRPTVVHSHTTGPSASGIGEGRESEYAANRQLHSQVKLKIAQKLNPAGNPGKSGTDSYYSHMEKRKKATIKEDGGVAMSVGSGTAVPSITNATANYAFQVKKKVKERIARRKTPNQVK